MEYPFFQVPIPMGLRRTRILSLTRIHTRSLAFMLPGYEKYRASNACCVYARRDSEPSWERWHGNRKYNERDGSLSKLARAFFWNTPSRNGHFCIIIIIFGLNICFMFLQASFSLLNELNGAIGKGWSDDCSAYWYGRGRITRQEKFHDTSKPNRFAQLCEPTHPRPILTSTYLRFNYYLLLFVAIIFVCLFCWSCLLFLVLFVFFVEIVILVGSFYLYFLSSFFLFPTWARMRMGIFPIWEERGSLIQPEPLYMKTRTFLAINAS